MKNSCVLAEQRPPTGMPSAPFSTDPCSFFITLSPGVKNSLIVTISTLQVVSTVTEIVRCLGCGNALASPFPYMCMTNFMNKFNSFRLFLVQILSGFMFFSQNPRFRRISPFGKAIRSWNKTMGVMEIFPRALSEGVCAT
jgi:hypothetical protein